MNNNKFNILTLKEKKTKFYSFLTSNYVDFKNKMNILINKYFENYVYFTITFLNEYKNIYIKLKRNDKDFSINYDKEFIDYFILSNNSLYFTFKDFIFIKSVYSEKIKYCCYNDNLKQKIFMYFPDIILTGFNIFLKCDEIVEKYYKLLLYLFTLIYKHFKDKNIYDNILEHLLSYAILKNNYVLNNINLELEFIYNILIAKEISTDKIQISPNILTLLINHFQKRAMKDFKNNSDYYTNNKYYLLSFHIMLCYSIQKNLPQRSYLFDMFIKRYHSNNKTIIDVLKNIFKYNKFYESNNEYIDNISLWTYLILSYFNDDIEEITDNNNNNYYFKKLNFNNNNSQMEINENNNIYDLDKKTITILDRNYFIKNMVKNQNDFLDNNLYKKQYF
jgi:hypothetical protein